MTNKGVARNRRARVVVVLVACVIGSFVSVATPIAGGATKATGFLHPARSRPTSSCLNPQRHGTVLGTPRLHEVPSLAVVTVTPYEGGLDVSFLFKQRLVLAPAGVLLSWRVFVYRSRHDTVNPATGLTLNIEDRGAGYEPSGWTITTALGTALGQVDGNVVINKSHDELSAFFPKGFGNMRLPFYWYANEWAIRSFLPTKDPNKPNYAVNGSVSFDCPSGTDASGTPNPKLLLRAAR